MPGKQTRAEFPARRFFSQGPQPRRREKFRAMGYVPKGFLQPQEERTGICRFPPARRPSTPNPASYQFLRRLFLARTILLVNAKRCSHSTKSACCGLPPLKHLHHPTKDSEQIETEPNCMESGFWRKAENQCRESSLSVIAMSTLLSRSAQHPRARGLHGADLAWWHAQAKPS